MATAAFGIAGASVDNKIVEIGALFSTVLANKRTVWITLEHFVLGSIWISATTVNHEVVKIGPFFAAVDAEKWPVLVSLKKDMPASG